MRITRLTGLFFFFSCLNDFYSDLIVFCALGGILYASSAT